jgi:hypothetical protein
VLWDASRVKNWPWIAAGIGLIALGVAFLVPMWIAAAGGVALVAVGVLRWARSKDLAEATP